MKHCSFLPFIALALAANPALTQTAASPNRCGKTVGAIPLCAVLSRPGEYEDKQITVSGEYRMVLHGSVLMSADCGSTLVNLRLADDYKRNTNSEKLIHSVTKHDQYQPVPVIVRGSFHVARQGQCFGQNCLMYELEDHEILCAEKPTVSEQSP